MEIILTVVSFGNLVIQPGVDAVDIRSCQVVRPVACRAVSFVVVRITQNYFGVLLQAGKSFVLGKVSNVIGARWSFVDTHVLRLIHQRRVSGQNLVAGTDHGRPITGAQGRTCQYEIGNAQVDIGRIVFGVTHLRVLKQLNAVFRPGQDRIVSFLGRRTRHRRIVDAVLGIDGQPEFRTATVGVRVNITLHQVVVSVCPHHLAPAFVLAERKRSIFIQQLVGQVIHNLVRAGNEAVAASPVS